MKNVTYLSSHHELHHKEEVLIVLVYVKELHDIRVVDFFQNIDLVL